MLREARACNKPVQGGLEPELPRVNGRNLGYTQRKQGYDGHSCLLHFLKDASIIVKKKVLRRGPEA